MLNFLLTHRNELYLKCGLYAWFRWAEILKDWGWL